MTSRNTLTAMVRENIDIIEPNLPAFWRRWVEDLQASGIDREKVALSMLAEAFDQASAVIGAPRAIAALRRRAKDVHDAKKRSVN